MKINPHYGRYVNNSWFMSSSGISLPWIGVYLLLVILIILKYQKVGSLDYYNKNVETDLEENAYGVLSITFLVYAATDITASFIKIIYRIMRYFYIGFTILLPEVATPLIKKNEKNRKILYFLFTLMAIGIAYFEFRSNKYRIFPYIFFWQ
jgi:hypothetical protein